MSACVVNNPQRKWSKFSQQMELPSVEGKLFRKITSTTAKISGVPFKIIGIHKYTQPGSNKIVYETFL